MPYSNQSILLTWLFAINGTDEIAVTGLHYTSAPGWTGAAAALAEIDTADIGDDLTNNMSALMVIPQLNWGDYSRLTGIKIAALDTAGHYLTDPIVYERPTPVPGATTQTLPQDAVVVSTNSGFTLGSGNRGRMYLPHCHLGIVSGTAQSNLAITDIVVAAARTMMNSTTSDLNDATTATIFPAIMSAKGSGTSKGVTELRVGTVNDTQRRRREQLTEQYSTLALA